MSHVFISYSKQNRDYARQLADHLVTQGFDIWIDDAIEPSDDWWRTIVRAVRGCAAFIVIMTPESDVSRWVQREVTLAEELKKPVFPLLLIGELLSSENWTMFVRTQYEDVRGAKLPSDQFYKKLVEHVPRNQQGNDVTDTIRMQTIPSREMLDKVATILPQPFDWCDIPPGQVTLHYGEWRKANGKLEYIVHHQQTYDISAFTIAKYPITNAQFQVFLEAEDGYRDSFWWNYSPQAQSWHKKARSKPGKMAFTGDDLPRTLINWYDAMAFCRWLQVKLNTGKNGFDIHLPTELQWQFAAQGSANSIFPWGNHFDLKYCNTSESGFDRATSVTQYPEGASPFGVFDMSGNVWEWCMTTWNDNKIDLENDGTRVLRGGSLFSPSYEAQLFVRNGADPVKCINDIGFRICANSKGIIRDL